MDALHWALVALVVVWTLVSLVLGALAAFLVQKIRAQLDRVDAILKTTHDVAQDVRAPVHAIAESVREVFGTPPVRRPVPTVVRDPLPGGALPGDPIPA